MNKVLLFIVGLVSAASLASAANVVSYTATADPNSSPDGVDQSANPVNVWTVTTAPGATGSDGGGSGFYSPFGPPNLGNTWQLFSFQNSGTGNGGSATATSTFAGGALMIGQTVSINFEMRALDAPLGTAGVSLLNGSGAAVTFEINGGGVYNYTDAGSTGASAGSMGYQYQTPFNIAFTVTGPGTYSAVAGSDSWTGTYSGSLLGMSVFDIKGGNASDVGFNNLTIVPEPGTLGLVAGGLVFLGYAFRRGTRRS
jgi:PEP-CTERM motif